jgi:DNA-binding winged helix-turn-helix (wHTH) protein/tetratricopeptide (TPR) repeat protein
LFLNYFSETAMNKRFYEFGPFRIDVANRLLLRGGEPLAVTPKAVDTLLALVQCRGQVLRKADLMNLVWPDTLVEESNLSQNIYLIRKALGERPNGLSYIETIPRRGYRFVADVREYQDEPVGPASCALRNAKVRMDGPEEAGGQTPNTPDHRPESAQPRLDKAADAAQRSSPSPRPLPRALGRARWLNTALGTAAVVVLVIGGLLYLRLSGRQGSLNTNRLESLAAVPFKPLGARSDNPDAYQAYLQGCYYLDNQTTRILESSIAHFQHATRMDSRYAAAYAGMAECYVMLAFQYDAMQPERKEAVPRAREAAARALDLNDQLPEAHVAFGAIKLYVDSDYAGAEREYNRAVDLNPGYAHGHHAYAILLFTVGRINEAVAEITRAEELEPLSVSIAKNVADGYYFVRQYDQAIEQYRRAAKLDPADFEVRQDLGWAYACRGMQGEAEAEFVQAMMLRDAAPERLRRLRQGYNRGGLKGFWRTWLDVQRERIQKGQLDPSFIALVYAFLGDKSQALAWLQRAAQDRSIDPTTLRFDPIFDPLRSDPRYLALLRQTGLTP